MCTSVCAYVDVYVGLDPGTPHLSCATKGFHVYTKRRTARMTIKQLVGVSECKMQ